MMIEIKSPCDVRKVIYGLEHEMNIEGAVRSASRALNDRVGNCLSGALAAAFLMERLGFPPLVLSLMSQTTDRAPLMSGSEKYPERIGHAIHVYKTQTGWSSIGKSRFPELEGRSEFFTEESVLVGSYARSLHGRGFDLRYWAIFNLDEASNGIDWRFSDGCVRNLKEGFVKQEHYESTFTF